MGCFVAFQWEVLQRRGGGRKMWLWEQWRGKVVLRLGRGSVESGSSGLLVSGFGSWLLVRSCWSTSTHLVWRLSLAFGRLCFVFGIVSFAVFARD